MKRLQTVVINLDRAHERMAGMEKGLSEIDLPFNRFSAIDGKKQWDEVKKLVDFNQFQRHVGGGVMPGEIGCYLSHLAVWREYQNSTCDVLLVLEDDVCFGEDFIEALQLATEASRSWDILKLNKIRAKQPISQYRLGRWSVNAYLGPSTGMGAYLIKPSVIRRLLPNMLPITNPIDRELDLIHKHDIKMFGMEPFPSWVNDGGQSTITGSQFSESLKYSWYRRLPCYAFRFVNLARRLAYLYRKGRLLKSRTSVDDCSESPS